MVHLQSPTHQTFSRRLDETFAEGHTRKWKALLAEKRFADGFLAVLQNPAISGLFGQPGYPVDLNHWLLEMDQWRGRVLSTTQEPEIFLRVLFDLWEALASDLTRLLREARLRGLAPDRGGVLAFVGGLSKCVVIRYDIFAATPRLAVVAVIDEPQSAFDFWGVLDEVNARARNHLKAILATGHKLVYHRGTLVHVDRRVDMGVFGPSIDTLVLAEVLAQELLETDDNRVRRAFEVGCGSGMLTVLLQSHSPALREIVSLDIDFAAVACTRRNCQVAAGVPGFGEPPDLFLVTAPFRPDLFRGKFDLVVCNPPYIPLPPGHPLAAPVADYFRAVGGTDLLAQILSTGSDLLAKDGKMLVMVSSLSLPEALTAVPSGFDVRRPLGDQGVEVLFDVEAVLARPEWLRFLVQKRGLVERGEVFFHTLHPIWIAPIITREGS